MKAAGVIVNIPTSQLNTVFTYYIPDEIQDKAVFGKRVLVDFAGKKTEAFIIQEIKTDDINDLKPVLRVLDQEPVFDQRLLELACWMADYYLAPLALTLSIMIPTLLHRPNNPRVIAGIDADKYYQNYKGADRPHEDLFKELWSSGELTMSKTFEYINRSELNKMVKSGLLLVIGDYQTRSLEKAYHVYAANSFDKTNDLLNLQRRAPRQAEAMQYLLSHPGMDSKLFNKNFTRQITNALLKKGYIRFEQPPQRVLTPDFTLNDEQQKAVVTLKAALKNRQYEEYLLFGVTGSGKTEVYLQAAQAVLQSGRSVIILVPEIALTRQLLDIFSDRIPDVAVLHSGMTAQERYEEWRRIQQNEACLVLGPRSAIFAPVSKLGLIIIDEEQENTFKQEELPRYHTRDVARRRAQMESALLLLGSATPAIETYHRAMTGEVKLLSLSQRTAGAVMPRVIIEDMRQSFRKGYRGVISLPLQERLSQGLINGEQSILFINRRGYSPMTICRECGTIATCPSCSVGLTYHQDRNLNVCHYCNYQRQQKTTCESCGSTHLQLLGSGTQKVEEEISLLFPQARVARLDMDSSRKKGHQKKILKAMKNGELDILIGTQMVAKGLDFPGVSLVGVLDADSILNLPDFRAAERCFQLLVQAAGRAGRADIAGEVFIQTYNPEASVIQMAANQDYDSFYKQENRIRKLLEYPPYTNILRIVFHSKSDQQCRSYSLATALYIEEMIDAKEDDIMLLGPASCPIHKIRNRYRHQILLKCISSSLLHSIAACIIKRGSPEGLRLEVDLNPMITM